MYDIDFIGLGERIRCRRHEKGLTQEKLAELCHLSSGYIGDIERADRILSLQTFMAVSYALEISPNRLLEDSLPEDMFGEGLDAPLKLRQPDRTLRNTLTNWYFADLPDESVIGEPPVTSLDLSRLGFRLLGDDGPFPCLGFES